MRSGEQLLEVVRGVCPRDYPGPGGDDRFVRACLAALGVFVYGSVTRVPSVGLVAGWEQLDEDEAVVHAGQGYPVVAVLEERCALVLPSRLGGPPWLAVGGYAPRLRAPLDAAFGGSTPSYWGHE